MFICITSCVVPPQVKAIDDLTEVTGVLGNSVVLEFVVDRATPPVTGEDITWFFGSNLLVNDRATFSSDILSVNISQLEYLDEGVYTLVASTAAGTGSADITLDIQGKVT